MIDTGKVFILPPKDGYPHITGKTIVTAPCGCKVFIGFRADDGNVATVAIPCDPDEHLAMMTEFQLRMKESLVDPTDEPLDQFVDAMLEKLYGERVATSG